MTKAKTTTAEDVKESAAVKTKKQTENLMYVGPTIPGVAIQNTVYTQIPDAAAEACKKVPEMRNLFIPLMKYPAAEKSLRSEKGYIYRAYNKAMKYKEGGK